ncbi:odorant receptor 49b-like isoform X2 [Cylas formicarius]|uniref:odorant receptor 49b-like isoform X2 n=1 Tax=Cylas formicarius TaxID=197179 RepID=UPI0029588682|nr:odorant receptor 49b-like isoform X2 [Cylas formicarius]
MCAKRTYFGYMRLLMMAVGIWRLHNQQSSAVTRVLYQVYSVLFHLIYSSAMISLGVDLPGLLATDRLAAMDNIGKFIIGGVTILKMFMCQSNDVVNLLRLALNQDAEISTHIDPEIVKIYNWHIVCDNKFISLLVISATLMGTCITILGDINCFMLKRIPQNNVTEKPLLLHYWYPFDRNKYYSAVIIDQNIRPTLACLCIGVVSAFANCVIFFLRTQLKVLQYNFRNFDKYVDKDDVERLLKVLCAQHQQLIKYFEKFNQSLKNIVFLEYLVSSVLFATLIVQITAGNELITNSIILLSTTVQLLTFSWTSNEIIVQSLELARALFESNWYDQTEAAKLVVRIMMMRCQKPLCLRVGNMGVMDLNAGLSRLKLGYSYTSIMSSGD